MTTKKVERKIKPEDLAFEVAKMDCRQLALFFNELYRRLEDFSELGCLTHETELSRGGMEIMRHIGECAGE